MEIINNSNPKEVVSVITELIQSSLIDDKQILFLISGGSNTDLAAEILEQISANTNLSLGLIDERYGEIGHDNSNWQKLIEAGVDLSGFTLCPVLTGEDFAETAETYNEKISEQMNGSEVTIGLFGIGEDGHSAGILPNSSVINSEKLVDYYEGPDFKRITLTLNAIKKINYVYVSAFGENKWAAISKIMKNYPLADIPACVFNEIDGSKLYTDYRGEL